ncbi:MAG: SIS domain-containing protein [Bacteroidales bacterium]|nr:SIS domain-containing protein [Bacteroidales bacterium]
MNNILIKAIEKYSFLSLMEEAIIKAVQILITCIENGGKILICGNGGSAADSDHIAGEMLKGFIKKRTLPDDIRKKIQEAGGSNRLVDNLQGCIPAISLSAHNALITAIVNDIGDGRGGEYIYAQQVLGLGDEGDVLIGISTSGNAINVYNAAIVSKAKKLKVICLTGKTSGKLGAISDIQLCVDETETWMIQDKHSTLYHVICASVEEYFYKI